MIRPILGARRAQLQVAALRQQDHLRSLAEGLRKIGLGEHAVTRHLSDIRDGYVEELRSTLDGLADAATAWRTRRRRKINR